MSVSVAGNNDLVWIALIGAAHVVVLSLFTLLGIVFTFVIVRMSKRLNSNTLIIADTHRMVNKAFGAVADQTSKPQ